MATQQWQEIDLGRLSDRELLLLVAQRQNELCAHVSAQNGRIGKLEQWRDRAAAIVALAVFAIPLIVSFVKDWLFK